LQVPLTHCKTENDPVYRVVLDPGHGGVLKYPIKIHGDRYDPVVRRYIDSFKPGAAYGRYREKYLMYGIARKTEKILSYLEPGGDFSKFKKILRKYTDH
jgi:N-acetylmuramoyl-L-alanine amidase